MLYMTLRTPLALGAGVVADATSATVAIAALGVLFLVVGGVVGLYRTLSTASSSTFGEPASPPES
jgi:hypothetical protein